MDTEPPPPPSCPIHEVPMRFICITETNEAHYHCLKCTCEIWKPVAFASIPQPHAHDQNDF